MSRTLVLLFVLLMLGGLAAWTYGTHWRIPDRHNPWAPLSLDEVPNWLTRHKLERLDREPQACLEVLEGAVMRAEPQPDRTTAPGCTLGNVVLVRRTRLELSAPFTLSCRAAVSLALWEQHVVLPEARRLLGSDVTRLDHYGSYACRNVYGREGARISQHAGADALDVAGFRTRDGRRITVAAHWGDVGDTRPQAQFLRAVHQGACRFFDGALGPGYNQAHADHLHLDRGPFSLCR